MSIVIGSAGTVACSNDKPSHPASAVIGIGGGVLASSDGALVVTVPQGALAADTMMSVVPITDGLSPETVGKAYDLLPDGTMFEMAIALKFELPSGRAASSLSVGTPVNGSWQQVGIPALGDDSLTALTMHLSRYALYNAYLCRSGTVIDSRPADAPLVQLAPVTCPGPTQCVFGGCAVPCAVQADCPRGLYCLTDPASGARVCNSVRCTNGVCPAELGVTCSVVDICTGVCGSGQFASCPAGQVCVAGTCSFLPCAGPSTCPSGSICYSGVCMPSNSGCQCGQPGCVCTADAGVADAGMADAPTRK